MGEKHCFHLVNIHQVCEPQGAVAQQASSSLNASLKRGNGSIMAIVSSVILISVSYTVNSEDGQSFSRC